MSDTAIDNVTLDRLMYIPRTALVPDPDNSREKLQHIPELALSIKESGLAQPLLVRELGDGKYMIVDGHRRHAASELAELDVLPCMLKTIDDAHARRMQVITAVQRDELSALELATALKTMTEDGDVNAVAQTLGKSPSWVRRHLALLKLPTAVITSLKKAGLGLTQAEAARKTLDEKGIDETLSAIQGMQAKQMPRREALGKAVGSHAAGNRQRLSVQRGTTHLQLVAETAEPLSAEQVSELERLLRSMVYTVPHQEQA